MLELGKKQKLTVINSAKQGVYLAENKESKDKVLLPAKQCDDNLSVGDEIEVFLYLDRRQNNCNNKGTDVNAWKYCRTYCIKRH